MCIYFILHQTEFIEKRNRLHYGGLRRRIALNKNEDINMVS